MGAQLRIGREFPPDPIDLLVVQAGHDYLENRLIISAMQNYLVPPHEPAPVLTKASPEANRYLASAAGRLIVGNWAEAFGDTITTLDAFHAVLSARGAVPEDMLDVADASTRAVQSLTARLDRLASAAK